TRMPISDGRPGKTFEQMLDKPDIKDQFAFAYPLGPEVTQPEVNHDPGRFRFEPFFIKMYGDCKKGEVTRRLKTVTWMPARNGRKLSVTSVNHVDERLADAVKELETLPAAMTKFLVPSSGTFNCRVIRNTRRLSVHAFAAAVDINDKQSDY